MSVYIVAEAGICHNGNLDTAYEMIKRAADVGADAVKFQAFDAELLGRPELARYELYLDQYRGLKRCCDDNGVDFLCSCFDTVWLDRLAPLMDKIKIASSKTADIDFLNAVARIGKPVILSTGMSGRAEIGDCLRLLCHCRVTVMHCVTDYPPENKDLNMRSIKTISDRFGNDVDVGYSDHTRDSTAAVMAVAMGATVIEKHFTLDSDQEGPDHHMSCEPHELWHFIENIRLAEKMLGDGVIRVEKGAEKNLWIKDQYNLSK